MRSTKPLLSVVVVFHNMRREAPRTLHSLTRDYQRGVEDLEYEVIALDNGSSQPLDGSEVRAFGPEFSYEYLDFRSPSPVRAMNHGVAQARGDYLMLCIDGARILSPGALRESLRATRCHPSPVVAILSWHLGPGPQDRSVRHGYGREVEDRLLEDCDWKADGYRLFEHSSAGYSSQDGWFLPIGESNALTLSRKLFEDLEGFEERFQSPGGGLANLDLFRRACEFSGSQLIVLLGEASFHQVHGGVSTNAPRGQGPWKTFLAEYEAIRGHSYEAPRPDPLYLGTVPPAAVPFLRYSAEAACRDASLVRNGTWRRESGPLQRIGSLISRVLGGRRGGLE